MKRGYSHSMMKSKTLPVIAAVTILSACAHGPSNRAIKSQCRLEMEAARTAVQMRMKGKSKQAMLQTLPPLHPDSTRLLRQMYQFVEDAYSVSDLNEVVYGIYRLQFCVRQLQHKPVPQQIQDVSSQLLSCQTQFGRQVSKQAIACVRATFPHQVNSQGLLLHSD